MEPDRLQDFMLVQVPLRGRARIGRLRNLCAGRRRVRGLQHLRRPGYTASHAAGPRT
ncbi:hypothetical protein LLE87_37505 [Paenibacillus polymyxa]|nr:hypothetical protein [Paenibacillus polymyxa]